MLAQLRGEAGQFAREGVRLALVVQATPEQAARHARELGSEAVEWVPDPEHESYRAMGLARISPLKLLVSGELWRRRRAAARAGFAQDWRTTFSKESDGLLLPGAALVDSGGRILWLHRGTHPGDLPPAAELLAVARERIGTPAAQGSTPPQ